MSPRLSLDALETIRTTALCDGGELQSRACSRPICRSAVARVGRQTVCLTCGWQPSEDEWGQPVVKFTPAQALRGSCASFRGLALLLSPSYWSAAVEKIRRHDKEYAEILATVTLPLEGAAAEPQSQPEAFVGDGAADEEPSRTAGPSSARRGRSRSAVKRTTPAKADASPSGEPASEVVVFTDGGCDPNPGAGGWAAILWSSDGVEIELAGGAPDTTNNRMELTAPLQALNALERPARVTIITDSRYVFQGITDWIAKWSRNGWRKGRSSLLNADLWRALAEAALRHDVSWCWTRGHAGQPENERCDQLAQSMIGQVSAEDANRVLHRSSQARSDSPIGADWKPEMGPKPTASVVL